MLAHQLDGAFVGLRAAVCQKHLCKNAALKQLFAQHGLLLVIIKITGVNEFCRLVRYGLYKFGIVIAQTVNAYSGYEICIFLARRVVQLVFVAADKANILPMKHVHIIFVRQLFDFFKFHFCPLIRICS